MSRTIRHQFLSYLTLLVLSFEGHAHEFWISPSTFSGAPGTIVDLELKVGQEFRGMRLPFIPEDIDRFELINEDSVETIKGLMGDSRPATKIKLKPGLNQIIHLTTPVSIHFSDEDERWANYIIEDGLLRQLSQYPDLPQTVPIAERYIRSVKSLITTKKATDASSQRLPFEIIINSPLPLTQGTHLITLLEGERPVQDILIKAFRYSDRTLTDSSYTNQDGSVTLNLPTTDQYLICGVVIRPDDNPHYDWISHWPAVTLEVSN